MKTIVLFFLIIFCTKQVHSQVSEGYLVENSTQKKVMEYLRTPSPVNVDKHVVVCAHRGAFTAENAITYAGDNGTAKAGHKYYFPENTLGAIAAAIAYKYEMIELDIKEPAPTLIYNKDFDRKRRSKEPMLSHDWTVGRMTNKNFKINEPFRKADPNNAMVEHYEEAELTNMVNRSFIIDKDSNKFVIIDEQLPGSSELYNMVSLRNALQYIINQKADIIVCLDIKGRGTAKKCLDIVTELKANKWVIFKLNADAMYVSNQGRTQKGMELRKFCQDLEINSPFTPKIDPQKNRIMNLVPMFTTNQVKKIPVLYAMKLFQQLPNFMGPEVDVKEGSFGLQINAADKRYEEMKLLASSFNASNPTPQIYYKTNSFHAIRDAKGTPDENGEFFDGFAGNCGYVLKSKLLQKVDTSGPKPAGYNRDLPENLYRWDSLDNRWNRNFLHGKLLNSPLGYAHRFVTSDEPRDYIKWLSDRNLRYQDYTVPGYNNDPQFVYSFPTTLSTDSIAFCGNDTLAVGAFANYKYTVTPSWIWTPKMAVANGTLPAACLPYFGRLDECKPINFGQQFLITSSDEVGAVALVNRSNNQVVFWDTAFSRNAHTAELLPYNRLMVANAKAPTKRDEEGNKLADSDPKPYGDLYNDSSWRHDKNFNTIQLFDVSNSGKAIKLTSAFVPSAHGILWDNKNQRVYVLGYLGVYIFEIIGLQTNTPTLVQKQLIKTVGGPSGDLIDISGHDLQWMPDSTKLVFATDKHIYQFDTSTKIVTKTDVNFYNRKNQKTVITHIKSISVNKHSGKIVITSGDETGFISEPYRTWSSYYYFFDTLDTNQNELPTITSKIPVINRTSGKPLDMYKARWIPKSN